MPARRALGQGGVQRLGRGGGEEKLQVPAILLGDLVHVGLIRLRRDQELGVAALGAVGLLPEAADRRQFARR